MAADKFREWYRVCDRSAIRYTIRRCRRSRIRTDAFFVKEKLEVTLNFATEFAD